MFFPLRPPNFFNGGPRLSERTRLFFNPDKYYNTKREKSRIILLQRKIIYSFN